MRKLAYIAAGLIAVAGANAANATVYYSFTSLLDDGIRSFTYSSATFIDQGIFASGELDSCQVMLTPAGHCTSVEFSGGSLDTINFTTAADRIASRTASRAAGTGTTRTFQFASDAFDKVGSSWSMDESATLTVMQSPAPEPASWLMMIAGFGVIGVAARRRGRLQIA